MPTKTNYAVWNLKMKVFMQTQRGWDDVESKGPQVVIDEKKDNTAMASIYQGIPEDMLLSLAEKETSKEVWDTIKIMCMGAYIVKTAKNRDIDGRD